MKNGRSFTFGPYELTPKERSLTRHGESIKLPPRAFEILAVLVENHGQLVEKKELMERVWPDSFVEEGNIQVQVSAIRRALGDETGGTYIETIPKVGYRFVATVGVPIEREIASNNGGRLNDVSSHANNRVRLKSSRTIAFVSVAILIVLLGTGLVWSLLRGTNTGIAVPGALHIDRITNSGRIQSSGISPNGKFVAYVLSHSDGKRSLYLHDLFTDVVVELTPPSVIDRWTNVVFSADSKYIYYSVTKTAEKLYETLFRISVSGGDEQMLLANVRDAISFAPDGDTFAFVRNGLSESTQEMAVASVRDLIDKREPPRTIASFNYPEAIFGRAPAWSPDGKTIACVVGSFAVPGSWRVVGYSPDGQTSRPLGNDKWGHISSVAWLKDSRRVVIAANKTELFHQTHLWMIGEDGGATQITNDFNGYTNISISADDSTVAAQRYVYDTNIYVGESVENEKLFFDTRSFEPLTKEIEIGNGLGGMDWGEDGRIVYSNRGLPSIFSIDASGENKRTIEVDTGIFPGMPRMSKDGRFLTFTAGVQNETALFRLNLENRRLQRLTDNAHATGGAIMPDGKTVVYTCFDPEAFNVLCTVPAAGGESSFLGNKQRGYRPSVSPDGKFVSFACSRGGRYGSCLLSLASPNDEARVTPAIGGGGVEPQFGWLRDSSAYLVNNYENGVMNIRAVPVDGSAPFDLTNFSDDHKIFSFGVSPNGKKLAIVRGIRKNDVVLIKNFQ